MRLIISIPYYRYGGVERVIISLLTELTKQVEKIIIISYPKIIKYFQELLPNSEVIIYEVWPWDNDSKQSRQIGWLNKLLSLAQTFRNEPVEKLSRYWLRKIKFEDRLKYCIDKYQATHCLYIFTNTIFVPSLPIPMGMISYDVFWRFAPLTYSQSYVEKYDQSLLDWLKKVDLVFTISEKTRQEILSLFPEFEKKIKPVPISGFLTENKNFEIENLDKNSFIFYFPSSFGIYKDQLNLLKAGIKLAEKGRKFKIILTGKQTDNLITGKLNLSQQKQTQEYQEYVSQCQQLYQENQDIFANYYKGLGFCDEQVVEYWYKNCDCVVMPSKYEGFGLALSEAVVRGLPVITSDLDVFHEQVELYKCGDRVQFFPIGDAEALAECMEKFILNPLPKLSTEEIKQRFGHWTWESVAKKYIELFQEI